MSDAKKAVIAYHQVTDAKTIPKQWQADSSPASFYC